MRRSFSLSFALLTTLAAVTTAQAPAPQDIRQVQIQVLISETNERGARNVGANLKYTRFVRGEEQSGSLQQIQSLVLDPTSSFEGVTLPVPDQTVFPPPIRPDDDNNLATGIKTRAGFGLTASVISPGYGTIESYFRAAETTNDVSLISKPEVVVVDQSAATIKAGSQIPYQSVTYDTLGRAQLSIMFQDVGVNMVIVPKILPDNTVELSLQQLDVSEVARIESIRSLDLPVFSKRSQTGVVNVPDGQTLVVGGLSTRVLRKSERRVPLIGAVPLLGVPFRLRNSEAEFSHLLIFVTPTVVNLRDMNEDVVNAMHFWRERGGEYKHTEEIERELGAMDSNL